MLKAIDDLQSEINVGNVCMSTFWTNQAVVSRKYNIR